MITETLITFSGEEWATLWCREKLQNFRGKQQSRHLLGKFDSGFNDSFELGVDCCRQKVFLVFTVTLVIWHNMSPFSSSHEMNDIVGNCDEKVNLTTQIETIVLQASHWSQASRDDQARQPASARHDRRRRGGPISGQTTSHRQDKHLQRSGRTWRERHLN